MIPEQAPYSQSAWCLPAGLTLVPLYNTCKQSTSALLLYDIAESRIVSAGMWYHLSLFLDAGELGVAYTGISTATALSQVIGGPLAAALLLLDGTWGLHGWQWLFICEGLPTVMFAAVLKVTVMRVCLMPCVGPSALYNDQKYSGVQTTKNYWAVVLQ